MWYFVARWRVYNELVWAQFQSLTDIERWWSREVEESPDSWGLEIYDRTGCRIFINIAKPYPGQIENYKKIGLKCIDLTKS